MKKVAAVSAASPIFRPPGSGLATRAF
jgi:hypothetical protein